MPPQQCDGADVNSSGRIGDDDSAAAVAPVPATGPGAAVLYSGRTPFGIEPKDRTVPVVALRIPAESSARSQWQVGTVLPCSPGCRTI
eukprot:7180829-Prymnesium_polylepis.1